MGPQGDYRADQRPHVPRTGEFSGEKHLAVHCSRVVSESTTMVRLARGRYGSEGQGSVRRPFRRGRFRARKHVFGLAVL